MCLKGRRYLSESGHVCLWSASLLGWFGLGGVFSGVQGLEEAEEAGSLADAAELDAEGLNLDEEVLNINDLVSDQRLEEDADQPDQTILHVFVFDLLTGGDAVGDVEVDELWR